MGKIPYNENNTKENLSETKRQKANKIVVIGILEGMFMLAAVKGIVQGNTVVIKDDDIREYDGAEVVVTLLDYPQKKTKKAPVDWDSFVMPSERGKHVDEYMKEMRENDRL